MSNTFKAQIKQNGEFVNMTGIAVFPFSLGELLDERLDEAYLRTVKDTTPYYEHLKEIKITTTTNGIDKDFYFIVANDNPVNYPIGSNYYKHEIYLIERTKLLEGILCQSITFTNTKSSVYNKYKISVPSQGDEQADKEMEPIQSPFLYGEKIPSIRELCEKRLVQAGYNLAVKDVEEDIYIGIKIWNTAKTTLYQQFTGANLNDYDYQLSLSLALPGLVLIEYTAIGQSGSQTKIFTWHYSPINILENKAATKPYTITDCVNRVLTLAEPLVGSQKPRYTFDGVSYDENGDIVDWYKEGSQAEYYDKIIAPEFSMTECTLREQLKVIGGFIHGEPYLDENNVVRFLDYGDPKKYAQPNRPYVYKSFKTDINQYCTEIRSNVQNLVNSMGYASGVVIDPCSDLSKNIRTETEYVRITENNGVIQTSLPIYEIQKLECNLIPASQSENESRKQLFDITPYVFEATEYSANLSSFDEGYPYSKAYALYYTIGSKNINGLFFKVPDAVNTSVFSRYAIANIFKAVSGEDIYDELVKRPHRIVFRVTYKPIVPTSLISHGKQLYIPAQEPFAQIYNQSGNLIESNYYGENMKGVAARLGNVEQTRTYIFKGLSQKPEVGELIDGYAVSVVNTELLPKYAKCTVGLSKDFNRISQYVGISSVKRLYEVSERNTYRRSVLYKEILVVGDGSSQDADKDSFFDLIGVRDLMRSDVTTSAKKITGVVASTYQHSAVRAIQRVVLPIVPFSLGNTISFAFSFKDNYSAGARGYVPDASVSGMWQNDVPYADYYGRFEWLGFEFFSKANPNMDNLLNQASELPEYPSNGLNLPVGNIFINNVFTSDKYPEDTYGRLLRLKKDNREEISVTYELEIKSNDPNLIIGSGLASECRYVSEKAGKINLELWLVKDGIYKFDEIFIPDDNDVEISYGSGSSSSSSVTEKNGDTERFKYVYLAIPSCAVPSDLTGEYLGWVLCTASEEEDLEVSSNDDATEVIKIQKGRKILLSFDASNNPIKAGYTVVQTSQGNSISFFIKK